MFSFYVQERNLYARQRIVSACVSRTHPLWFTDYWVKSPNRAATSGSKYSAYEWLSIIFQQTGVSAE
jgi:hypothetical protein